MKDMTDLLSNISKFKPTTLTEKEKAEIQAEERKKWKAKLDESGIPPRYQGCTFDAIVRRGVSGQTAEHLAIAKAYALDFAQQRKGGHGITFAGTPGRLKTTMAAAAGLEVLRQGHGVYFISMPELLDRMMSMSRNADQTELRKFDGHIRRTSLLILDDMGAEYRADWVLNKVDAIITARYNQLLPTIITTNLTPEQIKEKYMERIYDRLRSTNVLIATGGESLRRGI